MKWYNIEDIMIGIMNLLQKAYVDGHQINGDWNIEIYLHLCPEAYTFVSPHSFAFTPICTPLLGSQSSFLAC